MVTKYKQRPVNTLHMPVHILSDTCKQYQQNMSREIAITSITMIIMSQRIKPQILHLMIQ